MKKTVTVKGQKVTVIYDYNETRTISKTGKGQDERIVSEVVFFIDDKEYITTCLFNCGSIRFQYKGVTLPNNHKRVIEHILNAK